MIRAAQARDIPALLVMADAMHAESVYRDLPFIHTAMAGTFVEWMLDASGCFFVYVGRDGSIAGFIAGYVAGHFFSAECGAWDRIFYVRPERRGGIIAHALYQQFREWAKASGARNVWPGVMNSDAGLSFYRRLGLEPVATLFRDRL